MAANGIHDGTVPTAQQASFSSIHKFIQSFFFFFFNNRILLDNYNSTNKCF